MSDMMTFVGAIRLERHDKRGRADGCAAEGGIEVVELLYRGRPRSDVG